MTSSPADAPCRAKILVVDDCAGADDFLAKPLDILELLVRVRSVLRVRNIDDRERRLEAYVENLQSIRNRRLTPKKAS